jgi:hypothetical protein
MLTCKQWHGRKIRSGQKWNVLTVGLHRNPERQTAARQRTLAILLTTFRQRRGRAVVTGWAMPFLDDRRCMRMRRHRIRRHGHSRGHKHDHAKRKQRAMCSAAKLVENCHCEINVTTACFYKSVPMSHSVRKLLHFSAEIFPHAPRLCDLAESVICAPSPHSVSMRGLKIDFYNLFSSVQREPYGASRCPQQSS